MVKLLLATIGVFFALSVTAQATSSEQPAWVDNEATALAPSCGGLRAELIARMDYARQIHAYYVTAVALDPQIAKTAGDAKWHRYWADTYVQVVKMLKADCH